MPGSAHAQILPLLLAIQLDLQLSAKSVDSLQRQCDGQSLPSLSSIDSKVMHEVNFVSKIYS